MMDDYRTYLKGYLEEEIEQAFAEKESARQTTRGLFEMSETEGTFAPVDWDSMLSLYKSLVRAKALIHIYNEQFLESRYDGNFDEEIRGAEDWFHSVFTKALNYPGGTSKND